MTTKQFFAKLADMYLHGFVEVTRWALPILLAAGLAHQGDFLLRKHQCESIGGRFGPDGYIVGYCSWPYYKSR